MKKYYQHKQLTSSSKLIPLEGKIKVEMPKDILSKIKLLCQTISTVEWSGVLLYKTEGSIKDPSKMKIVLKDIIPMDKGSSAYTSYNFTEKERNQDGYSDKHIDYCEEVEEGIYWQIGLIHSHNSMGVFFSSTDEEELIDNAPLHNFYLSLIVNNNMDFEARVAIAAKTENSLNLDYTALDENGVPFKMNSSKSTLKKTKIFYYDCEIIAEEAEAKELDIFTRNLLSILGDKTSTSRIYTPSVNGYYPPVFPKGPEVTSPSKRKDSSPDDKFTLVSDYLKKFFFMGKDPGNRSLFLLLSLLTKENKEELAKEFWDSFSSFIEENRDISSMDLISTAETMLKAYVRNYDFLEYLIEDLEFIALKIY